MSSFAAAAGELDEMERSVGVLMLRWLDAEMARPEMAASAGSGRDRAFRGGGGGDGSLGGTYAISRVIALREYVVNSSARFSPTLTILTCLTKSSQFGLARMRNKNLAADESPASIVIWAG